MFRYTVLLYSPSCPSILTPISYFLYTSLEYSVSFGFFLYSMLHYFFSYLTVFLYLPWYGSSIPLSCTVQVYISSGNFCVRNVAAYLPEFSCPQRLQCVCSAFFVKFWIMWWAIVVRASVSNATGPGLYPAQCVFNMFSFAGFFRQMDSKYIT